MSSIIALTEGARLPAYLANRAALASVNDDITTSSGGFPVMSIKGKVFTLVKDGERKVLTRPDDPDEVLQSIEATVVRANTKARVFYVKAYTEGDSGEGAKPDCYSNDSVEPAADARNKQSAKCATCPHAVWGTGNDGKGTACSPHHRLAIVDPHHVGSDDVEPFLLRVPTGSRGNFVDIIKTAKARNIPYTALALKIGFDREAPSPKLTFRIIGLLDDASFKKVQGLYTDETVMEITGLAPVAAPAPAIAAPATSAEADLDAALAQRARAQKAAEKPAEAPAALAEDLDALLGAAEPAPAPAPAPKADAEVAPKPRATRARAPKAEAEDVEVKAAPAPAPAPAAKAEEYDDLLDGLDAMLGGFDD